MIEVKNLTYTYKTENKIQKPTVQNVSFSLAKGEVLGILGKTGSGKSTLIQMLGGILKPDSGEVLLNGRNVLKENVGFKVGLVFQHPEQQLFENTVFDDIAFGLRNQNYGEKEIQETVEKTANILGIPKDILGRFPLSLSGGEKRRCAIAGIIALKPEILVLDEPTAGMDFQGKMSLIECLENYHKHEENSIIIVSHVLEEIVKVCDKVLTMNEGKAIYFGSIQDLLKINTQSLHAIGIEPLQITKIMNLIKDKGFNVSENILTVNQAKKEIVKLLKHQGGESL